MSKKVAVIVGSLRKDSFNRKLALFLKEIAAPQLDLSLVEIGGLSLYNQDQDQTPPQEWVSFRQAIAASDAVLFVTPEYNRSVPGVLKNAVDIASRPYGQAALAKMPGAVISSSPGTLGGALANQHLRQSLAVLNMPILPSPEVYLSGIDKLLNAEGQITADQTVSFLKNFVSAFADWITHNPKHS